MPMSFLGREHWMNPNSASHPDGGDKTAGLKYMSLGYQMDQCTPKFEILNIRTKKTPTLGFLLPKRCLYSFPQVQEAPVGP